MTDTPQTPPSGPGQPAATRAPWMVFLRLVLLVDGVVLAALGVAFLFAPTRVLSEFGFADLPRSANYLLSLWGCVLLTLGFGYGVAATSPLRHLIWVQIGIARGALECVAGICYIVNGTVTWRQAWFGIAVAALIGLAYVILYPRQRRDIHAVPTKA